VQGDHWPEKRGNVIEFTSYLEKSSHSSKMGETSLLLASR